MASSLRPRWIWGERSTCPLTVPLLPDAGELECSKRFDALTGPIKEATVVRPLVSKLIPRHWMNVTGPAEEVVRRYQSQPRWLDAVDRLVNATLLDATGETAPQMVHRGFDEFFPMPQLH
ncbi:unnamed protein product [Durusdinium trenchii]|uniref:Selenoprotein O n=1 Tax=Durusdinium trenchii TaxID=1381693 RepID=A0ABP0HNP4_9DINO